MRILPLVLAAALAFPAIGFTADADKPRPFEDPNEPTRTPAGGNPTPTIIEIGLVGIGIIAVVAAIAAGSDDDGVAATGTTGTGTR